MCVHVVYIYVYINTTCYETYEMEGDCPSPPEATNEAADYSQMAAYYSPMVIMPSVQQHRLLSLLEQGLSILTPNNPTSASFAAAAEFIPFSAGYSQRWKVAYEHESLCKLHTAYNHPGRFGTKGRCFYKLENYIALPVADRCIVKPHS